MRRTVTLDTETTGLDDEVHRIIEIGCIEMDGGMETGRTFQEYLNPDRPIDPEATGIHGITDDMVRDKPRFAEVAEVFLAFIDGARLVIHNAPFDLGFLNSELRRCGLPEIANDVCDTVIEARKRFPGSPVNLDALCRRFKIDLSGREYHGALLDASLLAQVYARMMGLEGLGIGAIAEETAADARAVKAKSAAAAAEMNGRPLRPLRPALSPSADELAAHATFIQGVKDSVWSRILAQAKQES